MRAWDNHLAPISLYQLLDNCARHFLRGHNGLPKSCSILDKATDHRSLNPERVNDTVLMLVSWVTRVEGVIQMVDLPRAHLSGAIPVLDLLSQAFVESERSSFRRSIVGHFTQGSETCHAGNRNDMPVIIFNHTRQELLYGPEMR